MIPSGSSTSGPGAPSSFDIEVVEYTINCTGADFDPTVDPDIDSGPTLDQDVSFSGALEVLDTASGGVNTQDFGPDLTEVYVWQGFMDIPADHACTVQLRARDDDGEVICTATQGFNVGADATVKVNVLMICDISYQAPVGMVDLDGDFAFIIGNYCPDLLVLNCVDPDLEEVLVVPGVGAFVYSGCQVRFRDADSQCGESCDPQDCSDVTPAGINCIPGPDPGEPTTTVSCVSSAPPFLCAIPGALFGTACTPAPGDTCFDASGGLACAPSSVMNCGGGTIDPNCVFNGDTLGSPGNAPPAPLAVGDGGFLVGCTLADDDGDALTPPVPLAPGSTVTCTADTTDGDEDCDKQKTVEVFCPGLSPCQLAGPGFCDDGNECTSNVCDDSSGTATCPNDPVPDGTVCTSAPAPAICVAGACRTEGGCDTLPDPDSVCDDGDACTSNFCITDLNDPAVGTCDFTPAPDGTSCDSGGGPGSGTCDAGACVGPELVRVETYNVALAGAFIPYEQERRQGLPQAIAATQSDILCLQEVWDQTDKDAIIAAAGANFPYIVVFQDDLDTPLDDATDQNGLIPPPPTTVPCPDDVEALPGITIEDQMNDAIDCVRDGQDLQGNFCSTIPGSDQGRTTSTSCAAEACFVEVAGLATGTAQQQRCYACLATQLPTDTFGTIRSRCPTVVNQELAFQGQNGVMILSRYPLTNAVNWVIPGTWNRRGILSATAELPNGSDLDVYCNHLTPIFDDPVFPYTGQYGEGLSLGAAWEAEQFLQAEKLIARVQNVSGTVPAVILGDLNAGRNYFDDPNNLIFPEGLATLNLLEGTFTPAYATNYTPACTFCQDNPVAGVEREETVWIDHIHMYNLPASAVTATERTFDQSVIPVPDGNGGTMNIPLSDHYGMRSTIAVP